MPLLFLGNSYTFYNDLNLVVEAQLEATVDAGATTTRLADGGLAFPDHVARVDTHAEWEEALVSGSTAWEWGILQDQSQIPGFYGEDAVWESSASAGEQLDGWLEARGAQTVLLLTWGRRDGDSSNPGLYPDFSTMQDELTEGYVAYRDRFAREDRPVWIAPAGLAWAAVYAASDDPADPTSLFYRLYDRDGSHPSPTGTWLAACTIYSTLTGLSAEGLTPPAGVDPTEGAQLAAVAWAVVSTGEGGLDYPWEDTGGDDTGGDDTGGDDTGGDSGDSGDTGTDEDSGSGDSGSGDSGDTGPDGEAHDDTGPAAEAPAAEGCGCTTSSAAPGLWAGVLAVVIGARRRIRR